MAIRGGRPRTAIVQTIVKDPEQGKDGGPEGGRADHR